MLSVDVAAWAEAVADALRAHHQFEYLAVFIAAGDRLVLAAQYWGAGSHNGGRSTLPVVVPVDGSVVGRVFRTGSASLVEDTRHDPDYRDFPGGSNRSELAVPILVGGELVGVVNLESPRVGTFGIADLDRVVGLLAEAAPRFPGALRPEGRTDG